MGGLFPLSFAQFLAMDGFQFLHKLLGGIHRFNLGVSLEVRGRERLLGPGVDGFEAFALLDTQDANWFILSSGHCTTPYQMWTPFPSLRLYLISPTPETSSSAALVAWCAAFA